MEGGCRANRQAALSDRGARSKRGVSVLRLSWLTMGPVQTRRAWGSWGGQHTSL